VFEGVDRSGKTTQATNLVAKLNKAGVPSRFMRFPGEHGRPVSVRVHILAHHVLYYPPTRLWYRKPCLQRLRIWDARFECRLAPLRDPADRSTEIGKMINAYLTSSAELDDRCVHLLFSANRWEAASGIRAALERGETVVIDRYAYSGIAFSAAKGVQGMDLDWCASPDKGLPQPDVVMFMRLPPAVAEARGGFGEERYEKTAFQAKVREQFDSMRTGVAKGAGGPGVDGSVWVDVDAHGTIDEVAERVWGVAWSAVSSAASGAPLGELWETSSDRA
jgi:dTMP kinase